MESKLLKKNIFNKIMEILKTKKLTSLEIECLIEKLYVKLNNLSNNELLELGALNFVVTLENNDINLNIINKQGRDSIENTGEIVYNDNINEPSNIKEEKTIDLLNYRTNMLQDLRKSISDDDNFNTAKKLVLETPIHKLKSINFSFNNINTNKTEIHNFITQVKCDIIKDKDFNYIKFKDQVFNDIENIPYDIIEEINKDTGLYNNLLINIKLKYLLLQLISEIIYNKQEYLDNIEVYNNNYKNIEMLINKLPIDKIYIIKKNLDDIPTSISLNDFIVDLTEFINNLLLENDIEKLQKLTLYKKPKLQSDQDDPISKMLANENLQLKQKVILAVAKFQQQLGNKKKTKRKS